MRKTDEFHLTHCKTMILGSNFTVPFYCHLSEIFLDNMQTVNCINHVAGKQENELSLATVSLGQSKFGQSELWVK